MSKKKKKMKTHTINLNLKVREDDLELLASSEAGDDDFEDAWVNIVDDSYNADHIQKVSHRKYSSVQEKQKHDEAIEEIQRLDEDIEEISSYEEEYEKAQKSTPVSDVKYNHPRLKDAIAMMNEGHTVVIIFNDNSCIYTSDIQLVTHCARDDNVNQIYWLSEYVEELKNNVVINLTVTMKQSDAASIANGAEYLKDDIIRDIFIQPTKAREELVKACRKALKTSDDDLTVRYE
jgi:hypothetical protein